MGFTREEVIRGLRGLVRFLEENPAVPINDFSSWAATVYGGVGYGDNTDSKASMVMLASIPGKWRKVYDEGDGGCLRLYRDFEGGINYQAYASRSDVCVRRVVGKKFVEAVAIPEHEVEVVEWDCEPLLAPSNEASHGA